MGLVDRLALGAAERAGKALGARAGLAALRGLVDTLQSPRARTRAVFGALDYALELHDREAFRWLLGRWQTIEGDRFEHPSAVARRLVGAGRRAEALEVAAAECARQPDDPRTYYLRARCSEDEVAAADDLRLCIRRARPKRWHAVRRAATARLARLTLLKPKDALEFDGLSRREKLGVLAAMLHSKGRYGRVAALDGLLELASGDEVGRAAIRLAARHADSDGRLTEIEIDRIQTALGRWPDEEDRQSACSRLAARRSLIIDDENLPGHDSDLAVELRRARAVLERCAPPLEGPPSPTWRALDAIAAMQRDEPDIADRLEALIATLDGVRPHICPPLLTVAWLGRLSDNADVRNAAERIAKRLIALPGARPPAGWLRLAERMDDPALADQLLAIAVAQHEHGAADRMGELLLRRAWTEHAAGRRDDALVSLREVKRLHEQG